MRLCNDISFSAVGFCARLKKSFRPDPNLLDPNEFVAPRNSFAMSFRDFIPHLMNVLDQLGMSVHARTDFIKCVQLVRNFDEANFSLLVRISMNSPSIETLRIDSFRLERLLPPLT